jgi:hypothetical protein
VWLAARRRIMASSTRELAVLGERRAVLRRGSVSALRLADAQLPNIETAGMGGAFAREEVAVAPTGLGRRAPGTAIRRALLASADTGATRGEVTELVSCARSHGVALSGQQTAVGTYDRRSWWAVRVARIGRGHAVPLRVAATQDAPAAPAAAKARHATTRRATTRRATTRRATARRATTRRATTRRATTRGATTRGAATADSYEHQARDEAPQLRMPGSRHFTRITGASRLHQARVDEPRSHVGPTTQVVPTNDTTGE